MTTQPAPSVEEILSSGHSWYHTIDLTPEVSTPGWVDLRGIVTSAHLPADLATLRCLDIGTFDGFWAFQLESRGAAEVVAIDIDEMPPPDVPLIHRARLEGAVAGQRQGVGIEMLIDYFESKVERINCNVMDLEPQRIGGAVDFAFIGALLLHLRDPLGALENVFATLRPGGRIHLVEEVNDKLSRRKEPLARFRALRQPMTYWQANLACLSEWLRTAGFADPTHLGGGRVRDTQGIRHRFESITATKPA